MPFEPDVLLAILAMGLATYATRAGGFLLMRFMPIGSWTRTWLEEIPGAIIIAIVAPATLEGGVPFAAGVIATFLGLRVLRHELLAVVIGVAAVAGTRSFLQLAFL